MFALSMIMFASLLLAASVALPPAPLVPWSIDQPARELLADFNAGNLEAAAKNFNVQMRASTTPAVLAKVKHDLDEQAGAFKEVTQTRHLKDSGFKIVEFYCAYEKGPVDVRVTFDQYEKVGAISVKRIVGEKVDASLEAAARQLVDDFMAKRFEAAGKAFDIDMQRQLPAAKLAELRQGVVQRYGAFKSVSKVAQHPQQAYQVIDLTVDFDRAPATFSVFFDGAGRIAGMHIEPAVP